MRPSRPLLAALLASTLLAPIPALAVTTPEDAQSLQSQLHDWLADLVGPLLPAGVEPVAVTTDGDGFRLRIESPVALDAYVPHGSAVSLRATKIDGGRWALDDLAFPSPLTITLPFAVQPTASTTSSTVPTAPNTPQGQSLTVTPQATVTPAAPTTTTITLNSDKSVYHGIFDPALATESRFESQTEGARSVGSRSETSAAHGESSTRWEPISADGRMTIHTASSSDQIHQHLTPPSGPPADIEWARSTSTGQIDGLSPARLREAIQAIAPLLATGSKPGVTPEQSAQWHRFVDALFDLASSVDSKSELTGGSFRTGNTTVLAQTVGVDAHLAAPDGVVSLGVRMALKGLESPSVPPGVWQELMPHDLVIAPRLGGISRERLHQFLLDAVDGANAPDPQKARAEIVARMIASGVSIGIDELAFILGPTKLEGAGAMEITGPQQVTATADVTAHNLDQLLARAAKEPQLAQAVPFLTLARGLGKAEGDVTRWHIDLRNKAVLINGFDLAALTQRPATPPAAAPATPAPAQPR